MNSISNIRSFKMWAFRAVDKPELCKEYVNGHVKVLTDYGIANITSNNSSWLDNPNMYCVVISDNVTDELLGGIRIQIADGVFPLPVEKAIGYLDYRIYEKVRFYALNGGVGELSGLWVSNTLKGLGMGPFLVRAAISSSNQLNFMTMIGICAGYSLKMFTDVGFFIDDSLGNKGDFPYPNDTYIAHVVGILNASTLDTACEFDKELMLELRNSPVKQRIEVYNNNQIEIFYNLVYNNVAKFEYQLEVIR